MKTLYFWAILAFIGALMYIWPVFSVRRMYEGFQEAAPAAPAAAAPAAAAPAAAASAAAAPAAPAAGQTNVNQTLARMRQFLDQGLVGTPDLKRTPLNPPTAELPKPDSQGVKETPQPHTTVKSGPGGVYTPPKESEGLKQGASFQEMTSFGAERQRGLRPLGVAQEATPKPVPAEPKPKVIIQKEYVYVPKKCPQTKCPNVVCPDMRDYIRKDSIPCWACKLS